MVTVGDEPPHYMDQLTTDFKFLHDSDKLDSKWAEILSPIGDLRVARLDTRYGETAIAGYLKDKPIALLRFHDARDDDDAKLPWLAIGKASVVREHRGLGIMPLLIATWIDRSREPLLSDMRQSKDAYYMWVRMACSTKTDFEILVWHEDGSTSPLECADGKLTPDPTAGGDSTRWLARPRQL